MQEDPVYQIFRVVSVVVLAVARKASVRESRLWHVRRLRKVSRDRYMHIWEWMKCRSDGTGRGTERIVRLPSKVER